MPAALIGVRTVQVACLHRPGCRNPGMTWPLAPPSLASEGSVMRISTTTDECNPSPETNIEAILPTETMVKIFSKLTSVDLYRALFVSRSFHNVARKALVALYGVKANGEECLNYDMVLWNFDELVKGAGEGRSIDDAYEFLNRLPEYLAIKSVLEDAFGYCIIQKAGSLPRFSLDCPSQYNWTDSRKFFVVPYLLHHALEERDHEFATHMLGHYVRVLDERKLQALLGPVSFYSEFPEAVYQLVANMVSKSAIDRILKSPQKYSFSMDFLDQMALARNRNLPVKADPNRDLPIVLLWSLQQNGLAVPECRLLCRGLSEAAIPFWISLFKNNCRNTLELVQEKGDAQIQALMSNLRGPVDNYFRANRRDRDVYKALLIYLRFSKLSNKHVEANFKSTVTRSSSYGFYSLSALICCEQYDLISTLDRDMVYLSETEAWEFFQKLQKVNKVEIIKNYTEHAVYTPGFAYYTKDLILRKDDDLFIEIYVHALNLAESLHACNGCFCISLSALKCLAFGREFVISDIEEMLTEIEGYIICGGQISREVHIVHLLMFWKAPEAILTHYVSQIPPGEFIDFEVFKNVLLSKKYSIEFIILGCSKCELLRGGDTKLIEEFRPDVSKKLYARGNILYA